jgi:hypothetical protein
MFPEHDPTARIRAQFEEQDRRVRNEFHLEVGKVLRFCITGNAGGAVALLGLIGGHLGRNGEFPEPLFWLLATFLVGLLGGWAALLSYMMEAKTSIVGGESEREEAHLHLVVRLREIGLYVSGFFLVFGVVGSLSFLYSLAT